MPVGRMFPPGHAGDLAKDYAAWLASGEPFADLTVRAEIDTARRALDADQKKQLWQAWQDQGLPPSVELLTVSQAAMAQALIMAIVEPHTEDGAA